MCSRLTLAWNRLEGISAAGKSCNSKIRSKKQCEALNQLCIHTTCFVGSLFLANIEREQKLGWIKKSANNLCCVCKCLEAIWITQPSLMIYDIYLADPGEARYCSTNIAVIDLLCYPLWKIYIRGFCEISWFCLLVELHWEGSAPAVYTACLFVEKHMCLINVKQKNIDLGSPLGSRGCSTNTVMLILLCK